MRSVKTFIEEQRSEKIHFPKVGPLYDRRLHGQPGRLRPFCLDKGIEIITIYTFETACAHSVVRTRVFAPAFGYLEDPATGSGNAALACYLANRGQWREERLNVEQGISRSAPNLITIKKRAGGVRIGGQSVCRIEGSYILV